MKTTLLLILTIPMTFAISSVASVKGTKLQVLNCKNQRIQQTYYAAVLIGPNAQREYELTFTNGYYGMNMDYKYVLKPQDGILMAPKAKITNVQHLSDGQVEMRIETENAGSSDMICTRI